MQQVYYTFSSYSFLKQYFKFYSLTRNVTPSSASWQMCYPGQGPRRGRFFSLGFCTITWEQGPNAVTQSPGRQHQFKLFLKALLLHRVIFFFQARDCTQTTAVTVPSLEHQTAKELLMKSDLSFEQQLGFDWQGSLVRKPSRTRRRFRTEGSLWKIVGEEVELDVKG